MMEVKRRKRGRPKRVVSPPPLKYRYAVHSLHPSGIGSNFIKYVYTEVKPTWDNMDFFDDTNKEWAKWNSAWDKKEAERIWKLREQINAPKA